MSQQAQDKRSYKKTLNLPKTSFSMKANLVQNEPASLKRWQKQDLYQQLREARKGAPRYAFHDGPPYANGSIHTGHLLNKVLKDLVVRSKTMAGFDCPYTPGWDCHGLPIEHRVLQELGDKARDMAPPQIRLRCRKYAEKYIKVQAQQMQRLLTVADYDKPYLTMDGGYEAAVLGVFADLVGRGLVYRDLKPVHWSVDNQTALAEAELEYHDREDTSIYVLFDLTDPSKLPGGVADKLAGKPVRLMIWTTTPWTLPANLAVAAAPRAEYGLYDTDHGAILMAVDLAQKVLPLGGAQAGEPIATFRGQDLVGLTYQHPFIDRVSPVVTAEYVTLEDGTGLVHTAPGHGKEDYQTGLKENLDVYCPVREDGTFDDSVPQWLQGKKVWDANSLVIDQLKQSGHLFHDEVFTHSYPHDWRGKTPVIFRATEQWFIGVDTPGKAAPIEGRQLREMGLEVTGSNVQFIPEWGRNRMRGMLESRPDWCLSRQRSWGLPIPAFFPPRGEAGEPLLTEKSIAAVAKVFEKQGSDAWFTLDPAQLLEGYDAADDAGAPKWAKALFADGKADQLRKGGDTFDVWFESGSSWRAALQRMQGDFPADLYLEGSDQHRGWFQHSLLPALGATGQSPFKAVLTHGFMVDKQGRKMSKSLGNTLEVEELLKSYGADVSRWWVGSLAFENDIKVDISYFDTAGDEYRKVRNTIRFILSNLGDFDHTKDRYQFTEADAASIDAWALDQLRLLVEQVRAGYESFNFRRVHGLLFAFCNETMSATYLAATKDRLYCDTPESARRRRTQTVLFDIADALIRLLAAIIPHTADEAWAALHGQEVQSVHLELFPEPAEQTVDPDWAKVIDDREAWLKAIEEKRQGGEIDNPMDLGLQICACGEADYIKRFDPVDLADLCGVSRVELIEPEGATCGRAEVSQVLDLRDEPRCERSWKRDGTVKQRSDGGMLSDRDAAALGV